MANKMRDRLLELIFQGDEKCSEQDCRDCKYHGTYCAKHSDVWSDSTVYVDKDDYCSFGIRKKEGADNG